MCGGGTTQQTTSNTTASLPKYMEPYVTRNLARAEAEASKPYEAYTGERIADTDPNTVAGRQAMLNASNTGIAGLGAATDYTKQGMNRATELGDYDTGTFTEANFSDPGKFTAANAGEYMSPYMQAVVESQKSNAMLDFDRLRGGREAQAVNAGAFGGSRRFVQEGIANEGLARQLGDIQATGLQNAYTAGTSQFNADRSALTDVEKAKAAELARTQAGVEGSRQFGAGQGLAALNTGADLAGDLTKYGELGRQTDIQNAQLKGQVGAAQTAEDQARLDLDYANHLEQQGYTRDQINWMTSQAAGQPSPTNTSTVNTQPGPNALSQLFGAGLSAAGLYKAYT
jgi:hypothetical protein